MVVRVYTLAEVVGAELDRLRLGCGPTGLPSGIGLERRVPGGISRDKVTTLFAESGSFKTTVLGTMQMAMALEGHRVLSVSLEDSKELASHRLLAAESGLAYGHISGGVLTAEEVGGLSLSERTRAAADRVYVVDDVEPYIDAILDLAGKALCSPSGLSCLVIDYLQLLDGHGGEKDVITRAVKACSKFAKDHKVAVLLVSQQKQENERDHDNPRPRLGDMFGSSAMRMCSKLVLGLFRPWKYQPLPSSSVKHWSSAYSRFMSAAPDHAEMYPGIIEIHLLKNVLGVEKPIHIYIDPPTGVVRNFDAEMAPYL